MTAKKLPATTRQVGQLMGAVKAVPNRLVGDHLTDDLFVAYSMDPPELSGEAMAAVDEHLSSCDDCSVRMEHLLGVAEAWRGPEGEARLAAVAQRIRASFAAASPALAAAPGRIEEFRAFLKLWTAQAALGALAAAPLEKTSPNGLQHYWLGHDDKGNLRVSISSLDLDLEGVRIIVDPFSALLVLERVTKDQVGAEILIPPSARVGLPPSAVVTLRVDTANKS